MAIGLVSVVSLLATVIDLGLLASVVSFGALIAFSAVNLSVIKHYVVDEGRRGGADLGRYLLMPGIGFAMSVWLWTSLSQQSLTTGLIWLAVGVVYLVWLTRGFRRPPPEMDFAEAA